jgi:hypothetical protein
VKDKSLLREDTERGTMYHKEQEMSDGVATILGITLVGWKYMLGVVSTVWAFCCVDIGRMLRIMVIGICVSCSIVFGAMYVSSAQEQPARTMKDLQQDGRMDFEQNEIQAIKDNRAEIRAETLQHRAIQDQEIKDNSDRIFALSERVGRIEAIGSAGFAGVGLLIGMIELFRRKEK